ncbi:feruloyl-CoA synthase [Dyella terrae]|uniref:feruloyl-CoA synthase n=1 Tax=Dyella terrae TaxID=522259 RepID=UPI001EFC48F9|nr:feruloyl-CoA synthase [Dyella terrae]ULU24168.1 AMP-binding protein [Dyella terrae]
MATLKVNECTAVPFRAVPFPQRKTLVERRADGSILLRSATQPPMLAEKSFAAFIPSWAAQRGQDAAFCERDANGAWRSIDWSTLWRQVVTVAATLLERGLGSSRPVMLLSGNSIEQAVLLLACEYVGIPTAPVSPAYSLLSKDHARLRDIGERVPPAAVFVQDTTAFGRALDVLDMDPATLLAVHGHSRGQLNWEDLVAQTLTAAQLSTVEAAHRAIRPEQTARILFTSGSTGAPKGVNLTYGNFAAVAAYYADNLGWLGREHPVFLDWLPWYHGLGGVLNLGRSVQFGATHYIDDGRPLPGLIEKTVRNLRDVSPSIFTSVPSAWAMLATELERDSVLAQSLFSRVHFLGYGGASLPTNVWRRIQRVAEEAVGERIMFCTGLACSETTGMGTYCGWPTDGNGNVGVPVPGSEVKLLPLESETGRYEIRMRGANLFGGYVGQPELTAAAFDDEGYFRLGDAVRLADEEDPSQGMLFAGRVVEDFKLINGTWVQTGAMRLTLLDQCAPLLSDAVICGHDNAYVTALAWPNVAGCRQLDPSLAELDVEELVRHPLLVSALRERLQRQASAGASLTIKRVMLMAEPPSADANEIADKGYVNQAVTRARRAPLIEQLYEAEPAAHIACMS